LVLDIDNVELCSFFFIHGSRDTGASKYSMEQVSHFCYGDKIKEISIG
jgi:hypothetical protein